MDKAEARETLALVMSKLRTRSSIVAPAGSFVGE
jgi:hypothetical protein